MRFLIDITDLRIPLHFSHTKYTRVLRALATEIANGIDLTVEISKDVTITSTTIPQESPGSLWSTAIRPPRTSCWDGLGQKLLVLACYFGTRFTGRRLSKKLKDDLAWNLAYAFELFSAKWQERLVRFLDVDFEPSRREFFHYWLEERGLSLSATSFFNTNSAGRAISINCEDILILAGTSWRLDFSALEKSKKKLGFRLVCLIYDLIPVDYPSVVTAPHREQYTKFLCDVGRVVDLIVTPTESVAFRLNSFLAEKGVHHGAVAAISLGSASLARNPGNLSPRLVGLGLTNLKFMLCVSPLLERKHVLWLCALCTKLRQDGPDFPLLIIAGRATDPKIFRILSKELAATGVGVFIEDPLDEELSWLYQNARLCLQPSFEGGLGTAITEAVKYGRHCIAADVQSLIVASKEAAEHLPRDEALWGDAIRRALQREENSNAAQGDSLSALISSPGILSQIAALIEHCDVLNKEIQKTSAPAAAGEIDVVVGDAQNQRSDL